MSLEQVDRVLEVWRERLSAVSANLLDLQCNATWQSLTGTGGLSKIELTGVSAAQVEPALRAMHPLFAQFGALQAVVDRATELRSRLPSLFGAEAKLRELEDLLSGPSLEAEVTEVPLAERDLLTGARHLERISPEDLLDRMTRTFALVRDTVHAVGAAWDRVAQQAVAADEKLAMLRSQRTLPSGALAADLQRLEALLKQARQQASADPLASQQLLDGAFARELTQVRERIDLAGRLGRQLRRAAEVMAEVEHAHFAAQPLSARDPGALTVTGAPGATAPLEGLRAWLQRLQLRHRELRLEGLEVGLRQWTAAAERCLAQDRAVQDRVAVGAGQQAELQGRFQALRAKASARGFPGEGNVALQTAVEVLLRQRPLPLEQLALAVARYERALREHAGQGSAHA